MCKAVITMKRIIAVILAAVLALSALALSSCNCSSGSTVSIQTPTEPALKDEYGVGYQLNGDGTLAVTSYDGKDKDVSIPLDFEDKPIRNVAESAFKGSDIESVTMPDGMKTIDGFAFALCQKLNIVNIPEGVTTIGKNAFFGTFALTELELPETLETIDINAFNASAIEEIIIPENVKSVGEFAFSGCGSLTSVQFMGSKTKVASNAFDKDSDVTITAPKGSPAIKTAKKLNLTYIET